MEEDRQGQTGRKTQVHRDREKDGQVQRQTLRQEGRQVHRDR